MHLPPHIADRIRRTIASLQPKGIAHVETEGHTYNAIPLMGTIGSVWLLRADGSFWDVDTDSGKPVQPLPEDLHVTALVAGTERYPWLAELLPRRPENASDCDVCQGAGQIYPTPSNGSHGIFCPRCQALGWYVSVSAT